MVCDSVIKGNGLFKYNKACKKHTCILQNKRSTLQGSYCKIPIYDSLEKYNSREGKNISVCQMF